LIEAFLLAGTLPQAIGQIFNVGSGEGVSVASAAESIVQLVGSGSVQYQSWPADYLMVETHDFVADVAKIGQVLGWLPTTSWQEGFKKVRTLFNSHV
ncbi:MAG: NAD-dependent epimerase/dehydratase family protein, partial [Acidobacteriota bacterium]